MQVPLQRDSPNLRPTERKLSLGFLYATQFFYSLNRENICPGNTVQVKVKYGHKLHVQSATEDWK